MESDIGVVGLDTKVLMRRYYDKAHWLEQIEASAERHDMDTEEITVEELPYGSAILRKVIAKLARVPNRIYHSRNIHQYNQRPIRLVDTVTEKIYHEILGNEDSYNQLIEFYEPWDE